jgi:hypothetical protein
MHASLVPLMETIRQQGSRTSGGGSLYDAVFDAVRSLFRTAQIALKHARALVPAELQLTALQGVMRLMQQLSNCGALFPAAAAGTAAGHSSGSSSNRSRRSSSSSMLVNYSEGQCAAAGFVRMLQDLDVQQLDARLAMQVKQLQLDQAVQILLLQPVVAFAVLLHQHHEAQQQQQQQLLQRRPKAGALQNVLAVPAFHQDLLLPGGPAYVDTIAAGLAERMPAHGDAVRILWGQVSVFIAVLADSLKVWICSEDQRQVDDAIMLSTSTVRLVLELQLLAVEELRRLQQQQQPAEEQQQYVVVAMLTNCNLLLGRQIRAALQHTSHGCLPIEVLQQDGLQLLQALAAPVQQLQLRQGQERLWNALSSFADTHMQLYALRAAAEGMPTTGAISACKQYH